MQKTFNSDRTFHLLNNIFLVAISIVMLLPIIHILAVSLSATSFINLKNVYLWPKGFNLAAYEFIFMQQKLWRALGVSLYITVVGTAVALFFTMTISYALSKSYMPIRSLILKLILLTFIFSIGLIPFFLVVRELHMLNTLWALMVPNALGAWYVFITKTFFQALPEELFEAARMDGCNEFGLFARIALPMSLPVIATIGLFHSVAQWSSYFSAIIFIQDPALFPLQVIVRQIVLVGDISSNTDNYSMMVDTTPEQLRAGIILFATIPILLVYPFVQKHFVKGAMLGSLKE